MTRRPANVDDATVRGFGHEWQRYDQSPLAADELRTMYGRYFAIFPWDELPPDPVGFDLGCGSGRWARFVAPRVARLHCIDPSEHALAVAKENLRPFPSCEFHLASVDSMPIPDASMDFGYALGVLHHVPDTLAGIRDAVAKLKPGAPLLLYLYYAFDNRPAWFGALWRASDILRRLISRLPAPLKHGVTEGIAFAVYLPLARTSALLERLGFDVRSVPLSVYRHHSYYTIRTDALDRFGTRLERRFTAAQIRRMLESAGLERIRFSESEPFWCVVGYRGVPGPVA
jgi:SAM-dependent methyltransferase